nr:2'-5' RNA ligase superfamily [uncultured bacterium]
MSGTVPSERPQAVGETAIIVPVSVVEPLVSTWRARYDAAAADGVPAHVTLLYPFVPLADIDHALPALHDLFDAVDPVLATFSSVEQFPSVTYLAPEPAAWFKGLTVSLCDAFPACPPYGGLFSIDEVTPHLTVADIRDDTDHEELHGRFKAEARSYLPVSQPVTRVDLIARQPSGLWATHTSFELGPSSH